MVVGQVVADDRVWLLDQHHVGISAQAEDDHQAPPERAAVCDLEGQAVLVGPQLLEARREEVGAVPMLKRQHQPNIEADVHPSLIAVTLVNRDGETAPPLEGGAHRG